ncbi:MAG: translocation/assembly module TamB domain-containing protein, partial [Pseudomonadota bacterium]
SINLGATSSGERDYLSLRLERDGDALDTKLTLKSDGDGAIAAMARLGGPVFIDAAGGGPLSDYKLNFKSTLGAYGQFDGVLSSNFEKLEEISFALTGALGDRLTNTANIIGSKASLEGAFAPLGDGGELRVARFTSALGAVSGTARWRNRGAALDTVLVKASATLDPGWRPDLRPYIGDKISVDGEIRPRDGAYIASGNVSASYFDGVLKNVETDLRLYARGPASASLKSNAALPEGLSSGADVSGEFSLLFGDRIEGKPVTLKTASGGTFAGEARYEFDTRAFAIKGDAAAPPEMISAVNSRLAAKNNASGVVDIKGTPEKFAGTIAAILPPMLFDGKKIPAARASLAFADAPVSPAGQISARAIDGSLRLNANFARAADGALRAGNIDYAGAEFALKGNAALLAHGSGLDLDLAYRGTGGAEPFPGVPLAGDFTVKGAIARGAAANLLSIKSGSLSSGKWSIMGLAATAEGPSRKIALKASASALTINGAAPAEKIAAAALLDFDKSLDLTLNALTADLYGAPVKLSAPARLTFENGVNVENFRASVGRLGSLAIDGSTSKTRWRAKIAARRAPIVSAASVLDLDLDLDTDRKSPATGAFTLSSLLTKTENTSVSGRIGWNGQKIALTSDEKSAALDFNIFLPAKLQRSPAVSMVTEGAIGGDARFEGRVETLAGFLPAALQSIEGALSFNGHASGTLAEPKLSGDLALSNGAFTELSTGLSIVNIEATARAESALTGTRIDFKSTGSGVGQKEKTIFADGIVAIGKERRLSSKIALKGAKLTAGPVTEVEASGEINLAGPFSDLLAKGDITVRSLDARVFTPETTGLVDINVVRLNGDGAPAVAADAEPQAAIAYAIHITGDDRIHIRGRGLESEWRASVDIAGRAEAPVVLGSMTMKNGEIAFAGRRFNMTKGEISFDRLSTNNPTLDLRAERETKSGTQTAILIEGRARAPKISLTSTPALPQEDIMALILFDKPASELSAIESLQVAESLAELGGIGPFGGNGLTGSARQALGLDLLNVDIDQADSAASSLTVGKYVADGLFVSATQDARGENGSVRIEYEIDQSFTVETELRQDGDQKASVNWKHDF